MNKESQEKTKLSLQKRWGIIFRHLTPYKKELWFLSLLGIISALTNGTVPYIIGRFLDSIVEPSFDGIFGVPNWLFFIGIFATVQIIADLADWIIKSRSSRLGTTIHAAENSEGYSFLLTLPFSFHKNAKPGEITDTIGKSANALSNVSEHILINLTPQFLSIIVGLGVAFFLNIELTFVLIFGILIYSLLLIKVAAPLAEATREGQKKWGEASGHSHNINSNLTAVKQAGSEEYEKAKNLRMWVTQAAHSWIKVEAIWLNIRYIQNIIVTLTRLSVFILSVYFISRGELSIGELIAFNGYAAMVFGPFSILAQNWATLQQALTQTERAEEIFKLSPESYVRKGGNNLEKIGSIEFKNVSFQYKHEDPVILKNISFMINPGEIVALAGKTGVGKSTLIDLIAGYYEPTEGEIEISSKNIKSINLKSLRSHIATVPQEVALFDDSIEANIKYGSFNATYEEVQRVAKDAHVDEFVEKFHKKYNQEVGHRGIKLSVGQKQRVAIARAMLRNPSLLILDEPTSALDAETERYITESFEKLMMGRTTFIIAHRLSTVRKADRILFMEEGRIIEEGSHDELIKIPGGKYRQMYELHIGLH